MNISIIGAESVDDDYPEALSSKNAIRFKEENAEEYELALFKVLNRWGYAPLQHADKE